MTSVVTKDQSIHHDQYLDLIYLKYGTLYDLLHNVP